MSLLDEIFDELLDKLQDPENLNPARSDPIFYFVYPAEMMLELRTHYPRWTARLREMGLGVSRVSFSDVIWELVDKSGRWDMWLEVEVRAEPEELNEAVRDVLRSQNRLVDAIATRIEQAPENSVVFLTDAEMLHPYFRTRTIESYLHDRVKTPTVLFYPGRRSGQYGLHFLGFYPEDGNYRSSLIGGV